MTVKFATIDDYIASFPEDVQSVLQQVRRTIREAAPEAEETISYQIPAFKLNGKSFVHFAGWKRHISLYPIPDGNDAFQQRIAPYRAGKGTLRFPLQKPIPFDVIASVVGHLKTGRSDET
jgi:uncharacterized protein YdhG (YjbR/CyaY superfamily)